MVNGQHNIFDFHLLQVGNFVQSEPCHENPFLSDKFLATYLARVLPREVLTDIKSDLERFGERCATEIQVSFLNFINCFKVFENIKEGSNAL